MVGRVILLFALILVNGFFSCAEIAVLQVGEAKIRKLSEEGNKKAKKLLMRLLPGLGVEVIHPISIVLITIILSYISIVFGELVPKRLAQVHTEAIALNIASILVLVSVLATPLVFLLSASTNAILRLIGIDPDEDPSHISEEDILMMVDEGLEKGTIESSENEFIQNVFEFNDLTVEDVCTHRTDVAMLYIEDTDRQWRKTIHEHRFACYPICGKDDDDIIGILNTKDYFRLNDLSRQNVMKNAVDRPFFISQNMKVSDLFETMKKERKYYGVVLDEYGGMTGIVTLHDLIEALVGDLQEEDEIPEPEPIEAVGEKEWIILGTADLEDVNEELKIHLDPEAADTFGGYIMGILGKVPEDGSTFHLDMDNLSIDVAEIKGHRIGKTVVRLTESEEKKEEED